MAEVARLSAVHARTIRQVDIETWARVRALHARLQVVSPGLKMRDTLVMLLQFGLKHADRAWAEREEDRHDDVRE